MIFIRTTIKNILVALVLLMTLFSSCKSYKEQEENLADTPYRGTIYVSADETFKTVIDEQVQVYESNFPGTKIIVDYKPEAECLKDLLTDSVRMVIVTRRHTEEEKEFLQNKQTNKQTIPSLKLGAM